MDDETISMLILIVTVVFMYAFGIEQGKRNKEFSRNVINTATTATIVLTGFCESYIRPFRSLEDTMVFFLPTLVIMLLVASFPKYLTDKESKEKTGRENTRQ